MLGDNIYIQVELSKKTEIEIVFFTISALLEKLEITVPGSIAFKNAIQEYPGEHACFSDEITLDYRGNDYRVPACFYITFYTSGINESVVVFSMSASNHPAGELLLEHHEEMTGKLRHLLRKAGLFKTILYTNDSEYNTAELFLKYKQGIAHRELGIVYIL